MELPHLTWIVLPLTSCTGIPPGVADTGDEEPRPALVEEADEKTGPIWGLELVSESAEYDELELEDPGFTSSVLKDERRDRLELRASFGTDLIRGTVGAFVEEFVGDSRAEGFTFGLEGEPRIYTLPWGPAGVGLKLKYRLAGSITGAVDVTVDGQQAEFAYLGVVSELGLGLDLGSSFEPSFGVVNQSLRGSIDFAGETDHDWSDEDVKGEYTSAYVGLDYSPPSCDASLKLRALLGEVKSIGLTLGWGF